MTAAPIALDTQTMLRWVFIEPASERELDLARRLEAAEDAIFELSEQVDNETRDNDELRAVLAAQNKLIDRQMTVIEKMRRLLAETGVVL